MNNKQHLNLLQRVGLELLWAFAWTFSVLPHWFKYHVVENIIFFLLYHVLHYRRGVVMTNLEKSFPEKTPEELKKICRGFYLTLAEIFVDTFNVAHLHERKAKNLFRLSEERMHEFIEKNRGRDWIGMTAHLGCWEYCAFWGYYDSSRTVMSVYHPLHSRVIDEFYKRLRRWPNTETVPMKECIRHYLHNRTKETEGQKYAIGLIADQNPPLRPDSHWFQFLNQDTVFFDGAEKLALKCHLPVYFISMTRVERGCYNVAVEKLYDGVEEVAPNEITGRYVRRLEREIRENPDLWLWSHRRWKHKRPHDTH